MVTIGVRGSAQRQWAHIPQERRGVLGELQLRHWEQAGAACVDGGMKG